MVNIILFSIDIDKEHTFLPLFVRVQNLCLPLTNCGILGKLLELSLSQSPHLCVS